MLSITKQQLSELPEVKYPGKVILVDSAAKSRSALMYLNRVDQVGFDTETRPSFQKFRHYNVSLAQISAGDECFLFRLKQIGSLDGFMRFLENPHVQKIGLSLKDDFHSLAKLAEFTPQGFIELQSCVKADQIAGHSLQKIYGVIFNQRISKNQRLTNWEA
ncbi:MAG: 3'-5' exonuclease domain-containing protein 2, partial [Muribaculaceae bacterium]|nr:3'-5' exonuclease domain-containing protein 2 [Muribaculaceae bacterium]